MKLTYETKKKKRTKNHKFVCILTKYGMINGQVVRI